MPCPFTSPKMFCAGPNFLSQPQNLNAFSASSKTFVLAQKPILLNANHQYVNKCLVWHKKFGPAKNILGPVKGQGIRLHNGFRSFLNSNFYFHAPAFHQRGRMYDTFCYESTKIEEKMTKGHNTYLRPNSKKNSFCETI